MITRILVSGLFIITVFSGCKKDIVKLDVDITAPADGSDYYVGDSIFVSALSIDGELIHQYKVQMSLAPPAEASDSTFDGIVFTSKSYLFVSTENYNQDTVNYTIPLSTGLNPGPYYLIFGGLNGQFQEDKDTIRVVVKNAVDTLIPELQVFIPPAAQSYNKLDTLKAEFHCYDMRSNLLDSGRVRRVRMAMIPEFSGQGALEILNTTTITDTIRKNFVIPSSFGSGSYSLGFFILDDFNNVKEYYIPLTVN